MSRYIDIEPILEWCDNPEVFEPYGVNSVELERKIRQAPSIDIVRCKVCKHAHMTYDGLCKYCDTWKDDDGNCLELYLDGDYYCADGEREGEPQTPYDNCKSCKWWFGYCHLEECEYEPKEEPQTEDDKKHCVFCKWVYEPNVCGRCRNMNLFADAIEDEPQMETHDLRTNTHACVKTNADQHTQDVGSVESVGSNLEPFRVDEPQTERSDR